MKFNYSRSSTSLVMFIIFVCATLAASAQTPTISNFTPKRGGAGTTITITGTNFSATPAANVVYFGAVKSPVLTATATTLTVKVPLGASYKQLSVSVAGLTAWTRETFLPTFAGTGIIDNTTLADNVDFPLVTETGFGKTIAVVDFDGDGKPDIVVPSNSGYISFFRNTSTPGVITTASLAPKYELNIPAGYKVAEIEFSDVNNDGKKDLICLYWQSAIIGTTISPQAKIAIYKNQSIAGTINASSFAAPVEIAVTGGINLCAPPASGDRVEFKAFLRCGDFNLDGKEDLVVLTDELFFTNVCNIQELDKYNSRAFVFKNDYSGSITTSTFSSSTIPTVNYDDEGYGLAVGNLNGDSKPEVFLLQSWIDVSLQYNYRSNIKRNISSTGGAITFTGDMQFNTNEANIQLADFDLDSKTDLFLINSIRQNNVTGVTVDETTFGPAFEVGTGYVYPGVFCDVNGDGTPDICKFQTNATIGLIPNIHSGGVLATTSFGAATAFTTYGGFPWAMTCNDIDLDGKPDMIFYNSGGFLSVMRNQTPSTGAIVAFGAVSAGLASSATVPLTATDLTGIEGFQFTVQYDQTKLSYQNCSDWDAGVNPADVLITDNPTTGRISFVYNDQAFSIANGTFFKINFNVIAAGAGSTTVSWGDVPTPREFINSIPNIIPVTYNNGTVNIVNSLYSVSGTVSYDNVAVTAMGAITVELLNNVGTVIGTTTTSVSGQYSFSGLADGAYTVRPSSTKPWGGATSLDVTLYKKHIGNVPGFILTGLRLGSGDVNLSTTITSIDITLIKQRIGAQVASFQSSDWLFESGAVTLSGANLTKNIKAICYGDVNGSNVPQ